ncbi:MAG: short-chain dehydrogenase [Microbacterium sp.]|jgi:NAD(P)-dependent dehydrogenase (short-subunit alcohol dehydrogenase family)|uniref:SDR family NAD(P)-dependent oxidoreductase n=1 Tax=Microbacterium TaxID=33882 RepID=UPI000C9021CA|nr:SDR family oxidoreductase [Microbacterium sp. 4NA327F11]MAL06546.1 short-chain dehydrogenase [Microbacterium sp.]MBN9208247.1 SDR family oxidoreductase [Microbacterium ginsengisoli]MCK9915489.1 SDR family oxidoreductase [Microbacteriaceae bacterium K1510]
MSAGAWRGVRAIVTGGASGIGRATVEALQDAGAMVGVLDLAVDDLPGAAIGASADLRSRTSVAAAIDALATTLGGVDVLVNNAGISAIGTVEENDDDEWARVLDVNVIGMARASAAALPWLRRSERAAIVNVCSIAARNGLPQRALYSASKGAVYALTLAMATDHIREGVRVNCVCPGTVATPFVDRMLQNFPDPVAERAALDARQATGRMVTPAEVAAAILYLAHPASGSTTGTALDVDGGVTHLRMRPTP